MVEVLCTDSGCWDMSDAPLALLWTELEKPLSLVEGDSYEEDSEASKLATVRIVEGVLVFPLVAELV